MEHESKSPQAVYEHWASLVRRTLTDRQPGFYGLQPVKAAMAGQLGAEGAALALGQMLRPNAPIVVRQLQLLSLKDFAKARGIAHREVAAPTEVILRSPRVFGQEPAATVVATTRSFFSCILDDLVVSSKSNFLLDRDGAILDFQGDELSRVPLNLDVDPVVAGAQNMSVTVFTDDGAESPPLEEALTLVGVHSYAFGHWMLEFLPKLWLCLQQPEFRRVPILIDEQMPRQHREAVELFAGPDHAVVVLKPGDAVRVKRLWTCSMIVYLPLGPKPGILTAPEPMAVDTDAYAALVKEMRKNLDLSSFTAGRAIYLARKDSQHRRLTNRVEVENWLSTHGFQIFDFEALSFREQLSAMNDAETAIAADGSSAFLYFFAHAGTRVGILTHPFLEEFEWYAQLCHDLGLHLCVLTGDVERQDSGYKTFSDYRIDLARLSAFAEGLQTTW